MAQHGGLNTTKSGGTDDDDEFGYETTRCISSYYSIFVARLTIMVMLAILIGMLTILTWHFTRLYTTKSINSLAYGLRYELLQRPILRMWNIFNSTMEITVAQAKLSEYVIGRYENQLPQAQQVELHQAMRDITWVLFASRKALNAITISYKNGFVQAFHRDHKSNKTFYIYSEVEEYSTNNEKVRDDPKEDNGSFIWYRVPLDPITGENKGDRRRMLPDEQISIAGLPEVRDGTASWRVVVSKSTDSPLLSAALPVRHPSQGTTVAAVGVTTALKSVGQLMKELVRFHSGYMYLQSREGYLLATSTNAPLLRNSTTGLKLTMANDSEDRMIRSGAEWLQRDCFPIRGEVHDDNVLLGNQRYYIDSFFLDLKRLPLVGVIIIPRKYIMGKVDQIGFTTLIISISASVCILAIGCVCILILTSGVSKAMRLKAELISHLDARRRAEASSNYKSQFLANMSHELRTPMAAVIGLLDILMYDNCLTNEQFATVGQIRRCSTTLLRLLNNILDLSKVESGKLVLEEAEFDLARELEGLVDMFSVQCTNHNMEIILDLSDNMPKIVRGDSARVVQIFTNLISNSLKFTSEGHIILRGWCERTMRREFRRDDRITLWFEVEDTGCGIDPSKWESVFESFEQADTSTTRTHGGTGLGLCIVRNFVNKMDGEIKVVKKDGRGTLMQLYLVLRIPKGCARKHFQAEFEENSLTVLLALHGNKGRFIMSRWLRENGIFTWEASGWNEFTQILQQAIQRNANISTSGRRKITSNFLIVMDTDLLDQSTNIWKEQVILLDRYCAKAKIAWVINHNTSTAIKTVMRQNGDPLMVNKPLHKSKMAQILHTFIQEDSFRHRKESSENPTFIQINFDTVSSDGYDASDMDNSNSRTNTYPIGVKIREIISDNTNILLRTEVEVTRNKSTHQTSSTSRILQGEQMKECLPLNEMVHHQNPLADLNILLAEDNMILQRVAISMLEREGARVVVVRDGMQAVDAIRYMTTQQDREAAAQKLLGF